MDPCLTLTLLWAGVRKRLATLAIERQTATITAAAALSAAPGAVGAGSRQEHRILGEASDSRKGAEAPRSVTAGRVAAIYCPAASASGWGS